MNKTEFTVALALLGFTFNGTGKWELPGYLIRYNNPQGAYIEVCMLQGSNISHKYTYNHARNGYELAYRRVMYSLKED